MFLAWRRARYGLVLAREGKGWGGGAGGAREHRRSSASAHRRLVGALCALRRKPGPVRPQLGLQLADQLALSAVLVLKLGHCQPAAGGEPGLSAAPGWRRGAATAVALQPPPTVRCACRGSRLRARGAREKESAVPPPARCCRAVAEAPGLADASVRCAGSSALPRAARCGTPALPPARWRRWRGWRPE